MGHFWYSYFTFKEQEIDIWVVAYGYEVEINFRLKFSAVTTVTSCHVYALTGREVVSHADVLRGSSHIPAPCLWEAS